VCAKIVTVLNRKGGVGKTTLAIGIADTLIAEYQANTTIIDLDPQATASRVLVNEAEFLARAKLNENLSGLFQARLKHEPIPDKNLYCCDGAHKISGRQTTNLRLYPNSDSFWDLEAAETASDNGASLSDEIKAFLQEEAGDCEYIIIDCPPGQSLSTLAAVQASNLVICPITPDRYSEWGKELLAGYLKRKSPQTRFKFVVTRHNGSRKEAKEVTQRLRDDPNMLRVALGGQQPGLANELARFGECAKVVNRINMDSRKMLYRIYGDDGAKELGVIVDAIRRELDADG
jgi:cellulose biosynthesis protein BcsQ